MARLAKVGVFFGSPVDLKENAYIIWENLIKFIFEHQWLDWLLADVLQFILDYSRSLSQILYFIMT